MTSAELIHKMQWHVNREVKHYKTDFVIDCDTINRDLAEGRYGLYVWITRECGTHLIPVGPWAESPEASADYLDAIRQAWPNHKEYRVTLSPIGHHEFCTLKH